MKVDLTRTKNLQDMVNSINYLGKLIEPYGQYEGQFLNGEKHGKGRYKYNSQLIFEGEYRNGQKQGKGKLVNKDGTLKL